MVDQMSPSGQYYWENKFSCLEYKREYRFANIEKFRESERLAHIRNKVKRNAYSRLYCALHKEDRKIKNAANYQKNREKIKARSRARYQRLKDEKNKAILLQG